MKEKQGNNPQKELLQKYLDGRCSEKEEHQVHQWFYSFEDKGSKLFIHTDVSLSDEINNKLQNALFNESAVDQHVDKEKKLHHFLVAAIVLMLGGFIVWFSYYKWSEEINFGLAAEIKGSSKYSKNDIQSGAYFARIIGVDGQEKIYTDTTFLQVQNTDTRVIGKSLQITVPKAGMYKILLQDGTKVWVNSSTKITYPSQFSLDERVVQLEGEAYFEVAKDQNRPFRIQANGTQIEVLGTSFNVNAYSDQVKTSLVEGSVKLISKGESKYLVPGESGEVKEDVIVVSKANVSLSSDWKRGEITLEGSSLREIFDELSRWYNVTFELEENWSEEQKFKGSISRLQNLSKVLEILEAGTSLKFIIDGRKVIVQ